MHFAPGQVWQYRTRVGESDSRLLINKIEVEPDVGEIFHISVRAVRLRDTDSTDRIGVTLPHFPVSRATLEASVTALDGLAAANAAWLQGYATWRVAYEEGTAGVFSIPVAEIVEVVQNAIDKPA
jgi:hypothetical protein